MDAAHETRLRIAHELRTYNPAADVYQGAPIYHVWARELTALAPKPADGVAVPVGSPTWKELQSLAVKHKCWVPGYGPFAAELLARFGAAPTEQPHWVTEWLNAARSVERYNAATPATPEAEAVQHYEQQPDGTVTPVDPTDRGFTAPAQQLATSDPEGHRQAIADHEAEAPTRWPAVCRHCNGSGTVTAVTGHLGPDDYEYDESCATCGGTGSADIRDAVRSLAFVRHAGYPPQEMISRAAVLHLIDLHGIKGAA
jgi:hypothetical protein